MLDRQADIQAKQSIAPAAHTATVNGTGIDLAGFDAATVYVLPGTITDGTHTPKLQEAPDDATWTDVDASNLIGSFANIASNAGQKVGYKGTNRYIRVVSTVAGATTGGVYGAYVIGSLGRKLPLGA